MEARDKATVPLRQLGWGFLLAWVFCVFYTNAAGAFEGMPRATAGANLAPELFYTLMPLGSSVFALAVILIAEPRFGAPTSHRSLLLAAPLLTALSTPLMFLSLADPVLEAITFAVGSAATGAGSALLWVMWGEYYAVLPRENAEALAPVSAVSAALLVLLVSATDGWVAVALASLFPLLSGWCFYLVWTPDVAHEERALSLVATTRVSAVRETGGACTDRCAEDRGSARATKLTRTGFGILGVFSVVSIAGMLDQSEVQGLTLQIILLVSAFLMAVVAIFALSGPRRISLAFLYRWMCPVLVIGFAAIILLGPQGGIAAFAASLAGRFAFCLIAQIYFASYAASGQATPTQATSWGWLFVHAGDLVGCTLWVLVAPLATTAPNGILWVATLCIVALVVITMLTLNDTAVFHRVDLENAFGEGRPRGALSESTLQVGSRNLQRPSAEAPPTEHPSSQPASTQATKNHDTHSASASTCEGSERQKASGAEDLPAGLTSQANAADSANASATTQVASATLASQSVIAAPAAAEPDAVTTLAAAHRLTPRETEVFALLAQGRSIPYIRDELIISRETAATHAKHIYTKLGVHSRQELIDLVQKRETESSRTEG